MKRTAITALALVVAATVAVAVALRKPTEKVLHRYSDDTIGTYALVVEREGKPYLLIGDTLEPWENDTVVIVRARHPKADPIQQTFADDDFPIVGLIRKSDEVMARIWRARDGKLLHSVP